MLHFCFKLWRDVIPYRNPVLERLLCVMHYVYSKDIKPKKGAYRDDGNISVQFEFIRTTWKDFAEGIILLHRIDMALRRQGCSFHDRLLSSAIEQFKQGVLKNIEDKLKYVSETNGFARETMESNIFHLWKSFFDEEEIPKVIRSNMLSDLFTPLLGKPLHREIIALPLCSPYLLGKDFARRELVKEEAV